VSAITFANQLVDAFNDAEYAVEIEQDIGGLLDAIVRISNKKWGNPEFDPLLHGDAVGPGRCFWVRLFDRNRNTVAFGAARLVEGDLLDLTRSYRFWYGDTFTCHRPLDIVVAPDVPVPNGCFVYLGAGWISPDHRGLGITWFLARLTRALAADRWAHDYDFGFVYPGMASSLLPLYSQGFERQDMFARQYMIPGHPPQDLVLVSRSGDAIPRQFAEDGALLAADRRYRIGSDFEKLLRELRSSGAFPEPSAEWSLAKLR